MTQPRFPDTAYTPEPETDPNGIQPSEPGAKLDAGKPLLLQGVFLYFPLALTEVARVSTEGAVKYTWRGWESVKGGRERYAEALARHLLAQGWDGKALDQDSKSLHAAHVAWNALAQLELTLRQQAVNKEMDVFLNQ